MEQPTLRQVKGAYESKGYTFFDGSDNLNLWAVRDADRKANTFNDWAGITYRFRDGRTWCHFAFPATTDPGTYYRLNPINVLGTAVLKPGQYKGAYKVGTHKGYAALQQAKPVTVWRDGDRDNEADVTGIEDTGMFGLNIHRANPSGASQRVDKWSAGCQVLADSAHFALLMDMCRRSAVRYGNSFTLTLFRADELSGEDPLSGDTSIGRNPWLKWLRRR